MASKITKIVLTLSTTYIIRKELSSQSDSFILSALIRRFDFMKLELEIELEYWWDRKLYYWISLPGNRTEEERILNIFKTF